MRGNVHAGSAPRPILSAERALVAADSESGERRARKWMRMAGVQRERRARCAESWSMPRQDAEEEAMQTVSHV